MGSHIVNGEFQSDKYPTCPPGKVPLSVKDVTAQDLLWRYAQRRRAVDAEFSDDLELALKAAGYTPPERDLSEQPATLPEVREAVEMAWTDATHLPEDTDQQTALKALLCDKLQSTTELIDKLMEPE